LQGRRVAQKNDEPACSCVTVLRSLVCALVLSGAPALADPVGVTPFGDAHGGLLAASLSGNSTADGFCESPSLCISGLAISGTGNSQTDCDDMATCGIAVSGLGQASGSVAVGGAGSKGVLLAGALAGNATTCLYDPVCGVAISGTGSATGFVAVAGQDSSAIVAAMSVFGNATACQSFDCGPSIAISVFGDASGAWIDISGCNAVDDCLGTHASGA
jgi:hypothetical protein